LLRISNLLSDRILIEILFVLKVDKIEIVNGTVCNYCRDIIT